MSSLESTNRLVGVDKHLREVMGFKRLLSGSELTLSYYVKNKNGLAFSIRFFNPWSLTGPMYIGAIDWHDGDEQVTFRTDTMRESRTMSDEQLYDYLLNEIINFSFNIE